MHDTARQLKLTLGKELQPCQGCAEGCDQDPVEVTMGGERLGPKLDWPSWTRDSAAAPTVEHDIHTGEDIMPVAALTVRRFYYCS